MKQGLAVCPVPPVGSSCTLLSLPIRLFLLNNNRRGKSHSEVEGKSSQTILDPPLASMLLRLLLSDETSKIDVSPENTLLLLDR